MNEQRRPIKDSFIERLKDNADIGDVISNSVQLKSSGSGRYMGLCPFHDEKTPSFSVNSEGFFHCFGCGVKGDTLGFIMQSESLDFYDAVHRLADMQNIKVEYVEAKKGAADSEYKHAHEDYKVNQVAADFYAAQLKLPHNKVAMEYLHRRKCSAELIEEYRIGYAPPANDALWQHIKNDNLKEAALRVALVRQSESGGYYDVFRNRVIFPIIDARQRVLGFGGRVIGVTDKAKYINSSDSHIFHKEQHLFGLPQALNAKLAITPPPTSINGRKDRILVVEGYTDVLAMFGLERTVACLGTAFSKFHARQLLKRFGVLALAFDGDEAGSKAAIRAMRQCFPFLTDDKELLLQFMPQGKDPYDLVNESHDKQSAWYKLKPLPIEEFLLQPFYEAQAGDLQQSRLAINQLVGYLADFPPNSSRVELIRQKAGELLGGVEINLPSAAKPTSYYSHSKPTAPPAPPVISAGAGIGLQEKLIVQLLLEPKKAAPLLNRWRAKLEEASDNKNDGNARQILYIIQAAQRGSAYLYGYVMAMNIKLPDLGQGMKGVPSAWYSAGDSIGRILEGIYKGKLQQAINDGNRDKQKLAQAKIQSLKNMV